MFKPTKATTTQEYILALPADRQETILFLHNFIQQTAPSLRPHFAHNMLGYGSFRYRNYKKELIDWPVIALAIQKNYISLYICAVDNDEYIAEKYKAKLGNVDVGKSCVRFKRLEDLDLAALKTVIQLAEKQPGYSAGANQLA